MTENQDVPLSVIRRFSKMRHADTQEELTAQNQQIQPDKKLNPRQQIAKTYWQEKKSLVGWVREARISRSAAKTNEEKAQTEYIQRRTQLLGNWRSGAEKQTYEEAVQNTKQAEAQFQKNIQDSDTLKEKTQESIKAFYREETEVYCKNIDIQMATLSQDFSSMLKNVSDHAEQQTLAQKIALKKLEAQDIIPSLHPEKMNQAYQSSEAAALIQTRYRELLDFFIIHFDHLDNIDKHFLIKILEKHDQNTNHLEFTTQEIHAKNVKVQLLTKLIRGQTVIISANDLLKPKKGSDSLTDNEQTVYIQHLIEQATYAPNRQLIIDTFSTHLLSARQRIRWLEKYPHAFDNYYKMINFFKNNLDILTLQQQLSISNSLKETASTLIENGETQKAIDCISQ